MNRINTSSRMQTCAAIFGLLALTGCIRKDYAAPADYIFEGGAIYTADQNQTIVDAIAITGDKIVYVGDIDGAAAYKRDETQIIDLSGRTLLPGFHDLSLNAIASMEVAYCTLADVDNNDQAIVAAVTACKQSPEIWDGGPLDRNGRSGRWLIAADWDDSTAEARGRDTIRATLDAASPDTPVLLVNTDKTMFAVNSAGLARATAPDGRTIGLSKETLADAFATLTDYIGVDRQGAPTGRLNGRAALTVLGVQDKIDPMRDARIAAPAAFLRTLHPYGFTSVLESIDGADSFAFFDALLRAGAAPVRTTLAQQFDLSTYTDDSGYTNFDRIMLDANRGRVRLSRDRLVKADMVRLLLDRPLIGVPQLPDDGPPALPPAAVFKAYRQPVFAAPDTSRTAAGDTPSPAPDTNTPAINADAAANYAVQRYINLDKDDCRLARDTAFDDRDRRAYKRATGHFPEQCTLSRGTLLHDEEDAAEFAEHAAKAGFSVMFDAHGDRAVHHGLAAFDTARERTPRINGILRGIGLLAPNDFDAVQAGDLAMIMPLTPISGHEITTRPFLDWETTDTDDLASPPIYDASRIWAPRSKTSGRAIAAGAIATATERSPWAVIDAALSSMSSEKPGPTANTEVTLPDLIDAYTINAARAVRRADETGSIQLGKKADFIILGQDIFAQSANTNINSFKDVKILQTWVAGRVVFDDRAR